MVGYIIEENGDISINEEYNGFYKETDKLI
jgi:hypothetical protein